jgi:hypothetical protein
MTPTNIVLRANNVDLATHALNLSDLRFISDKISVSAAKKVRKGSLLICTLGQPEQVRNVFHGFQRHLYAD